MGAVAACGSAAGMQVGRVGAPTRAGEDHSKDIDFSSKGIRARWEAGRADTTRALLEMPWNQEVDRTEGFVLHEVHAGRVMAGDETRGTLGAKTPLGVACLLYPTLLFN